MSRPKTATADCATRDVLELAARIVPRLLAGDHRTMAALRKQYERARVLRVEVTGETFVVDYEIPDGVPRVPPLDFARGDVKIPVAGVGAAPGWRLFVLKGRLASIEGTTCEDLPERR